MYPNSAMTPYMITSHHKGHEPSGFPPLAAPTTHATLPNAYQHGGQRSSDILYPYDVNRRLNTETPVIYIGVSLVRPVDYRSWGISLMKFDQYLVVEKVRQDLMHRFATWAWATTVPPRRARCSEDFRSCFGPLHATSLLQLIPGDEIVSVNGQPAVLSEVSNPFNSSRVDIVAVRRQGARSHAQNALLVRHGDHRVAEVACRPIQQPLLRLQALPHPSCQRALFSTGCAEPFCNRQHGPENVGNNTTIMKRAATRSEDYMGTPPRSKGRRRNDLQPLTRLDVGTNVSLVSLCELPRLWLVETPPSNRCTHFRFSACHPWMQNTSQAGYQNEKPLGGRGGQNEKQSSNHLKSRASHIPRSALERHPMCTQTNKSNGATMMQSDVVAISQCRRPTSRMSGREQIGAQ